MQSTGKSSSSKSLRIGTWAMPLAPPPDKTSPILGRSWEWAKAMINRGEMKRRTSLPFFPVIAHPVLELAAAFPIGVGVEVVEFGPHIAEVTDHDEKVLGPAREVPDIIWEQRLSPGPAPFLAAELQGPVGDDLVFVERDDPEDLPFIDEPEALGDHLPIRDVDAQVPAVFERKGPVEGPQPVQVFAGQRAGGGFFPVFESLDFFHGRYLSLLWRPCRGLVPS